MNLNSLTALFCTILALQFQVNAKKISLNQTERTGIYKTKFSTENYVDFIRKNDGDGKYKSLVKYDLLDLEKKYSFFQQKRFDVSALKENLNEIYELCGENRMYYLPYTFKSLSFEKDDLIQAIRNSTDMLSEIKTITSGLGVSEVLTKLKDIIDQKDRNDRWSPYVTSRYNQQSIDLPSGITFDDVRRFLNFKVSLKVIGLLRMSVEVSVIVPSIASAQYVYGISYVPVKFYSDVPQTLVNHKLKYAISMGSHYVFLEDINDCQLKNDYLMCTKDKVELTHDEEKCLENILNYERVGYCKYLEISGHYDEFTDLGKGKFHFLVNDYNSLYEYSCAGEVVEKNEFNMIQGIVEIERNCMLSTAHTTVAVYNDGSFNILRIDNAALVSEEYWNDFPWETVGIVAGSILIGIVSILLLIFVYRRLKDRCSRAERNDYEHLIGNN